MKYYEELKKFYFKLFKYNVAYFYDDYDSIKSGLYPQWLMSHRGYYSVKLRKILSKNNWLDLLESYYDELYSEQSGVNVDDIVYHLVDKAFDFEKYIWSQMEQIFNTNYTMYKKVDLFDNGIDEIKNLTYSAIFKNWSEFIISNPYNKKYSSEILIWWIYNQIDTYIDCEYPRIHLVEQELHKKITTHIIPLYARIYASVFIDYCSKYITKINYVNDNDSFFEYYDIKYLPRTMYKGLLSKYLLAYVAGNCEITSEGNNITISKENKSLTITISSTDLLLINNSIVSIQYIKVLLLTMFGLSIKDISFYIQK